MKKLYYLLSALTIFLVTFISCEKDLIKSENTLSSQKNSMVSGTFDIPEQICAGEQYEYCFNAPLGTKLKTQQWDDNTAEWVLIYKTNDSNSNPVCFPLQFDVAGDYHLRYQIGSGSFSKKTINVQNCDDCDESFNYLEHRGGAYTFTYIPSEDMENALVVFTFAQSVTVTGLDENENWSNEGQTMQKETDLIACKTYSWTLKMTKDCNGNTPNNNVWTDFKVDNISKKNLNTPTPNIVYPCDELILDTN